MEPRGNDLEESKSANLPSPKEPDSHFLSGGVDENQHEPVYDSSPPEDKESELYSEREGKDSSNYEETHGSSSVTHPDNETEPRLREVQESSKGHVTQVKSSGVNLGDQNGSEYVVEHVSVIPRSSYTDVGSVEEGMVYNKGSSEGRES
ncbi:hypothetical protein F2P56_009778 [Juglans regia]|uniref:Uncharacterized protein n=1 Tax=Juglans regia TaxID=51240 RepID=A0A833XX10_JUGRE|nr:hypothetical protein F2P56_009774 [Juglans regia]KAF5473144.1 hypothetical protein F2P56_009778 [Juglans regia]